MKKAPIFSSTTISSPSSYREKATPMVSNFYFAKKQENLQDGSAIHWLGPGESLKRSIRADGFPLVTTDATTQRSWPNTRLINDCRYLWCGNLYQAHGSHQLLVNT